MNDHEWHLLLFGVFMGFWTGVGATVVFLRAIGVLP